MFGYEFDVHVPSVLIFLQSDIIHQSVYDLIHSEDREELRKQLQWDSFIISTNEGQASVLPDKRENSQLPVEEKIKESYSSTNVPKGKELSNKDSTEKSRELNKTPKEQEKYFNEYKKDDLAEYLQIAHSGTCACISS